MNNGIDLNTLSRPYKVEVFGLQDEFIGTLQPYTDCSIRQLESPHISLKTDGTASFTFSVPFYIQLAGEERKENPLWEEAKRGLLAENVRILKVFIKGQDKVMPFIIDQITESRESNFQVNKEVTCSGLAEQELGKVGYKLSLTSETVELDKTFDSSIEPTINYWLDQVFPNEKIQAARMMTAIKKVFGLPELLQSITLTTFPDKKQELIDSLYALKNYSETMINDIIELIQANLENTNATNDTLTAWNIITSEDLFSYNLSPLLNNINTLLKAQFPEELEVLPTTSEEIESQRTNDKNLYNSLVGSDDDIGSIDAAFKVLLNDIVKIKYWHESGANLIVGKLEEAVSTLKESWQSYYDIISDDNIQNPYTPESPYIFDNKRETIKINVEGLFSTIEGVLSEKDGYIFKWLTPWSYEIRMDWSGYTGIRESSKIYEAPYVSNWDINEKDEFVPSSVIESREKARFIDCTNSNKYNITQDIAEAFEVFCYYEYDTDQNGLIKELTEDASGNVYTGRKVIFYNEMIDKNRAFSLNYEKNLNTFSRETDSSEIYTKLYVNNIDAENLASGVVSIAETPSNPLMEDFILDFQYLEESGKINEFQIKYLQQYQIQIAKINRRIKALTSQITKLSTEIETVTNVDIGTANAKIASAEKQKEDYTLKIKNTSQNIVTKENLELFVTLESSTIGPKWYSYTFTEEGVQTASIKISTSEIYPSIITNGNSKTINNISDIDQASDRGKLCIMYDSGTSFAKTVYFYYDEDTRFTFYFSFMYDPVEKYKLLLHRAENVIVKNNELLKTLMAKYTNLKNQLIENQIELNQLNEQKNSLNNDLHLYLGPALREGYYNPESYEDPGEKKNFSVQALSNRTEISSPTDIDCKFRWDNIPLSGELEGTYIVGLEEEEDNTTEEIPGGEIISKISGEQGRYFIDISRQISEYGLYFNNYCDDIQVNFIPKKIGTELNTNLAAQTCYFVYLGRCFYFTLGAAVPEGYTLSLVNFSPYQNSNSSSPYGEIIIENDEGIQQGDSIAIFTSYYGSSSDLLYYEFYIEDSTIILYPSSGYEYGFIKKTTSTATEILPTIIISASKAEFYNNFYEEIQEEDSDINISDINEDFSLLFIYNDKVISQPDDYQILTISTKEELENSENNLKYELVYPRISIQVDNVNYYSENFEIYQSGNNSNYTKLDNNYAYSVILKELQPLITLKVSEYLGLGNILNSYFKVNYIISRANEMLYLDAKKVAHENSQPKYTYSVGVSNIPENISQIRLGDLVYINDYTLNAYRVQGYISEIDLSLDTPQQDNFIIANYKTKFEDLFTKVTATSEAVSISKRTYDNAASKFDATGLIVGDILQQSFNDNKISFTSSLSKISIDDSGGMIIQSADKIGAPSGNLSEQVIFTQPVQARAPLRMQKRSLSSVSSPLTETSAVGTDIATRVPNGQIALRSGGIFCSDSVDNNYEPVWTAAITPSGINATSITTGILNTENIKIYSGTDVAFQWNEDGIFAYKTEGDSYITSSYVGYSKDGLKLILNNEQVASFGFDGIRLSAQDGAVVLDQENGLRIFNNDKEILTLGRYSKTEDDNTYYGLRIFDNKGEESFYVNNDGILTLNGQINATSGSIGGWSINSNGLSYKNKNDIDYFSISPSGITSQYFSVNNEGLTLGKGTIDGEISLGDISIVPAKNDEKGYIGTSNFASGAYGWQIQGDGSAEFNNLTVRGKIQSSVFEYNHINSIGGDLYISPSVYLETEGIFTYDSDLEVYKLIWPFAENNIIVDNGIIIINGRTWSDDEKVKLDLYLTITINNTIDNQYYHDIIGLIKFDVNERQLIITVENPPTAWNNIFNNNNNESDNSTQTTIAPGALLVLFGNQSLYNSIYLTANSMNGPYLDVYSNSSLPSEDTYPQVRLGNLNGIKDSNFKTPGIAGYGLYAQNAYIRGEFALPGGGLTNKDIYKINNTSNDSNYIILWAGALENKNGYSAPFYVTNDGSMYANNGHFKGIIEATDGTFSGELGVVKLVLNKDADEAKDEDNQLSIIYKTDLDNQKKLMNISKQGLLISSTDFPVKIGEFNEEDKISNTIFEINSVGFKAQSGIIDSGKINNSLSFGENNDIIITKASSYVTKDENNQDIIINDCCGIDFSTKKR